MELASDILLSIKNISYSFAGIRAVSDFSADFPAGSINALIGPNGAGKTTAFNLCSGFIAPSNGCIYVASHPTIKLPPYHIARLELGRTFQDCKVFNQLSVFDNVMLGFRELKYETILSALLKRRAIQNLEQSHTEKTMELLKEAGLDSHAQSLAGDLSYGQRKLVELCRVQAMNPKIFLLDEPFAGLSPKITETMHCIISRRAESGCTILFIEHDMHAVAELADRVLVMQSGRLIADGEPKEILHNPVVLDAYLGGVIV